MKQKRKAQVGGIIFIFVVFGLIFLFVFFYMWMEKNMTRHAEKQAEIVASDVELIAFYSELIQKHGIELAQKDNSGTEDVIEKFAEQYLGVNASYSADCSKTGDDKECKLTISLHATLGTVIDITLFATGVPAGTMLLMGNPMGVPMLAAMVAIKYLATKDLKSVQQEAYLPLNNKAINYRQTMAVEFA